MHPPSTWNSPAQRIAPMLRPLPNKSFLSLLRLRAFAPISIASLVYFRIMFGILMLWEVWRYFHLGRIRRYWIDVDFHFTYYGFDWVRPLPGSGMYTLFLVMGLLAFCIMIGYWYRIAMTLFWLCFTYMFLLDQALYLNHFYLIILVSFLMIFVPAHRSFSVDAWRRSELRSDTVPTWTLWLLLAQISIVYFYGGLAKLNPDWLAGQPMKMWLAYRTDMPIIGVYFTHPWAAYFFSYGGLLFDLLVAPLLFWRKTRWFAFIVAVLFHLTNNQLFNIGIFPWFMIAATALYFPADWPLRLTAWVASGLRRLRGVPNEQAQAYEPVETRFTSLPQVANPEANLAISHPRAANLTLALLALYLIYQLLFPLRHFLYKGNVSWTEEGHRFSWRMKLRDKEGAATFYVTNPSTGETRQIAPESYLKSWQLGDMMVRPEMILQFSHYLAHKLESEMNPGREGNEITPLEVRVFAPVSLNGRPPQLLIDPSVNLAEIERSWRPATWILPLEESSNPIIALDETLP